MARILQLANFVTATSGGLRVVMDHLARGYAVAGHEVHVVRPGTPGDEVEVAGIDHPLAGRVLPMSGGYRVLVDRAAVVEAVERVAPDHIEVHDRTTLGWVPAWADERGIATTVVVHERLAEAARTWLPLGPLAAAAGDLLDRRLAGSGARLVVPSRWAATALDGGDVTVVPLGVDLTLFHPSRRRRPPSDTDELRLVTVGRLSREKAPSTAVEVVRRLVARGRRVHLDLVGEGPLRGRIEEAAAGLPITIHGHVRDRVELASLMADADVGLAPCPREAFGLAALELLACGTPVVAPHAGGVVEVLGPDAGISTTDDVGMLASAVERLAERDVVATRAAARARATAFPWSSTVAAMLERHGLAPANADLVDTDLATR